jgi:DNA-binding transcriptional ArsR family regulator
MLGDADIAAIGSLLAEPARARILTALGDGRALPASVLAAEAGIAASTASEHLARLVDGGLLQVEAHGRHRYFRLAGPQVGELIETIARLAPPARVRSLRQGTRAEAIRAARTCYDHLAGRLGVAIMSTLIAAGDLTGGDGRHVRERARKDRPSAMGRDLDYRLTDEGADKLANLGVDVEQALAGPRTPIRYCIDWSEQDHHLSGALGAALAERFFELKWVKRLPRTRAVLVTDDGRQGLAEQLNVALD